jgi:hypothetical protein
MIMMVTTPASRAPGLTRPSCGLSSSFRLNTIGSTCAIVKTVIRPGTLSWTKMKNDRPAKPRPVVSTVSRHDTGRSKNFRTPIAARQIANNSAVPPNSRGTSESGNTTRSIAIAAPAAAANAEPVQNRDASNDG